LARAITRPKQETMTKRLTSADIFEFAFCLLGAAVGAVLAALSGYALFGDTGAIVAGIAGLIFGFVGTRAGADWFAIFR
jgi:membrane associated rhomboid family serine protease